MPSASLELTQPPFLLLRLSEGLAFTQHLGGTPPPGCCITPTPEGGAIPSLFRNEEAEGLSGYPPPTPPPPRAILPQLTTPRQVSPAS